MNKLHGILILMVALLSCAVDCGRREFCLHDVAGYWTLSDWNASSDPNDTQAIELWVDVQNGAITFHNLPSNGWDMRSGMAFVRFEEICAFDEGGIRGDLLQPYRVAGNTQYEYVNVWVSLDDNQIIVQEIDANNGWVIGPVIHRLDRL